MTTESEPVKVAALEMRERLVMRLPTGIISVGRWISIGEGDAQRLWEISEVVREPREEFLELILARIDP